MIHNNEVTVSVQNVSKNFKLPHEKNNSIKTIVTGLLKNKEKSFEVQHALKNISFDIKKGEFFGIVGRNGSGKSTLLKILAGIYQPTTGSVKTAGKVVPFIELGVGFNPELTGRENIFLNGALLGFTKKEMTDMYDDIVEFAEIERFMDQKLKNYSSGMQVRLAFAVATRAKAGVLIVDEVLAVGDSDFQKKCFTYFKGIKRSDTTVVFVTHDMNAVREYCDRAVLIEKNEIQKIGDPEEISVAYSKLFSDSSSNKQSEAGKDRWGNKSAEFTEVEVISPVVRADQKDLTIKTRAHVNRDLSGAVVGYNVKNESGTILMGNNSTLLHQKIHELNVGQDVEIEWTIPNIFNAGRYFIDVSFTHENGVDVCDWWKDASSFVVDKEPGNPYSINPEVKMTYKKVG
ncbi:MAG: tagH [Candidatus Saccharibacteria bacterium]|nr:tagH [Candidatus Saccharibacteria bacterium]